MRTRAVQLGISKTNNITTSIELLYINRGIRKSLGYNLGRGDGTNGGLPVSTMVVQLGVRRQPAGQEKRRSGCLISYLGKVTQSQN